VTAFRERGDTAFPAALHLSGGAPPDILLLSVKITGGGGLLPMLKLPR
jgi:hypothetical protein